MNIKPQLDNYLQKIDPAEFIANDPIQFAHRFTDIRDIEISAFVTSCLSFGSRKLIIAKCEWLHNEMGDSPYNFIANEDYLKWQYNDRKFYRFYSYHDLYCLFDRIYDLFMVYRGIGEGVIFIHNDMGYMTNWIEAMRLLFANIRMIPQTNNSACKRLNMFLRWVCRKDAIDLGIWDFIPTSELLIPLDTHVAKQARMLGLLTRKQDDMKAVIELTNKLKEFDANDPTKYDLVLFSLGIDNKQKEYGTM